MQTNILRFTRSIIFIVTFFSLISVWAQQKLPVRKYTVGLYVIQAEMATTQAQRQVGLMNRKELSQNEGMMFIFDFPAIQCMWMKNTLIPLSVAFMNEDNVILNIEEMQPQSDQSHCALKPALKALEMNAGWFKRKNIKPGSKIELLR
ncbi:MAG: hypothetical protein K0R08_1635 [Solimicrobium sp.]|jgi:uncharacterized membrane protein (UPF0127 family)|nr:hypothetical protein [Solimicrobium sp.]